jgi:hypothetical protein
VLLHVSRQVSALPVVNEGGVLQDIYARADITKLCKGNAYNRLQWEDVTVRGCAGEWGGEGWPGLGEGACWGRARQQHAAFHISTDQYCAQRISAACSACLPACLSAW